MVFDAENIALIVLGLLLFLVGAALLARRRAARRDPYPFEAAPLLDVSVQALLPQVVEAVGGRYLVCPAVPLAQLVRPRSDLGGAQARLQAERLADHQVDVLLCALDSWQPLGALLIDRAQDKGGFRAQALLAAGIPPVRLRRVPAESPEAIRRQIEEELGLRMSADVRQEARDWVLGDLGGFDPGEDGWSLGVREPEPPRTQPDSRKAPGQQYPPCRRCGAPQVVRRASRGRHQGQDFLVCSRFPDCQQLRPLD